MKKMSRRQREDYEFPIVITPENYQDMSTEECRAFIAQELATGRYATEESMAIEDLIFFAGQTGGESPEFFIFRQLVGRHEPAKVVPHLEDDMDFELFFDVFGLDVGKAHMSNAKLLDLHEIIQYYRDDMAINQTRVKAMLEERGAESVGAEVTNEQQSKIFVEVFGLKAIQYVPKDIARKFKGKHLEDGLGL
jgi:hypothetical protein